MKYNRNEKVARQQPRRVLQYLKFAVPKITDEEDRACILLWEHGDREWISAFGLSYWLPRYKNKNLPEELVTRIEDWYLTELAALDNVHRCKGALEGLKHLFESCGISYTLKLFKTRDPDILEARLRACAQSDDTTIQVTNKDLLQELHRFQASIKAK